MHSPGNCLRGNRGLRGVPADRGGLEEDPVEGLAGADEAVPVVLEGRALQSHSEVGEEREELEDRESQSR